MKNTLLNTLVDTYLATSVRKAQKGNANKTELANLSLQLSISDSHPKYFGTDDQGLINELLVQRG